MDNSDSFTFSNKNNKNETVDVSASIINSLDYNLGKNLQHMINDCAKTWSIAINNAMDPKYSDISKIEQTSFAKCGQSVTNVGEDLAIRFAEMSSGYSDAQKTKESFSNIDSNSNNLFELNKNNLLLLVLLLVFLFLLNFKKKLCKLFDNTFLKSKNLKIKKSTKK
jgi:hypothetical protein